MRTFQRFFVLVTFVCFGLSVTACTTNPATGERSFTGLMSLDAEKRIGSKAYQEITGKDHAVVDNQKITAWVKDIGARLARHSERTDISYTFTVLNSDDVNAFAMPGGYIYITRGLLAMANDESEVAAVLAHEMAHVTARHSAQQYSHSVVTGLGAALLGTLIEKPDVTKMANLGGGLYLRSYSREHEHQADTLGVRYLEAENFDPYAMARFLRTLYNHTQLQARLMGQKGGGNHFSYFATHPTTQSRIQQVNSLARHVVKDGKPYMNGRSRYFKAVEGMVYGDSVDQGFVRGHDFIHVPLDFRFQVPKDYILINDQKHVLALNNAKDARIVFDQDKTDHDMTVHHYMRDVFAKGVGHDIDITPFLINGNPAVTVSFDTVQKGKKMHARLVAIKTAPQSFFRFVCVTTADIFNIRDEGFMRTVRSFRRLTAKEKRTIQPYRVHVINRSANQNIADMVEKMAVKRFPREHFIVMNGLDADNPTLAGRKRVKIVQEK
jgi:predicted Zn-dependent protease